MLRVIEIEHIKGIQQKSFELDIHPSKPSLLVTPNGFDKSSLATAFNSMNFRRIALDEEDYHAENASNAPRVYIEYTRPDSTLATPPAVIGNLNIKQHHHNLRL